MLEPPKALKITLSIPVKWRRITNGEKVIWQTGPDESNVEVVDADDDAQARILELRKLIGDAGRPVRKRQKFPIPSSPKTAGAKSQRKAKAE